MGIFINVSSPSPRGPPRFLLQYACMRARPPPADRVCAHRESGKVDTGVSVVEDTKGVRAGILQVPADRVCARVRTAAEPWEAGPEFVLFRFLPPLETLSANFLSLTLNLF